MKVEIFGSIMERVYFRKNKNYEEMLTRRTHARNIQAAENLPSLI